MNNYFLELTTFPEEDLKIITDFFWESLYPAHTARSTVLPNNKIGQYVTYFDFTDITNIKIPTVFLKYPVLARNCLIIESHPGFGTMIHIDGQVTNKSRRCAINFPITGGSELSPTRFFGMPDDYEYTFSEKYSTTYLADGVVPNEVARISIIDKPALLNVKTWHTINNNGTEPRIALSWTCQPGLEFARAAESLKRSGYAD